MAKAGGGKWSDYSPRGVDQRLIAWVTSNRSRIGLRQSELARRVGMTPQKLTNTLKGKRRFSAYELKQLSSVFGCSPPNFPIQLRPQEPMGVVVMGHISGSSFRASAHGSKSVAGMPSERFPIEDQRGFEVDEPAPEVGLLRGDTVLTVPMSQYAAEARNGGLVLFRRERDGLVTWTLGEIEMRRGVRTYRPVIGQVPDGAEPEYLVVGMHRSFA